MKAYSGCERWLMAALLMGPAIWALDKWAPVAWALWLAAGVCAAWSTRSAQSATINMPEPSVNEPVDGLAPLLSAVKACAACCLLAVLLEAGLKLHHHENFDGIRQEGKLLLLSLAVAAVIAKGWLQGPIGQAWAARALSPMALQRTALWHMALLSLSAGLVLAMVTALLLPRAELPDNPVPWGTAVALGVAVLLPVAASRFAGPSGKGRALKTCLWLGAACGMAAVLLSRTRAAWVVFPWCVMLLWAWTPSRVGRARLAFTTLTIALALIAYDMSLPPSIERGVRLLDFVQEAARVLGLLPASQEALQSSSLGSRWLLWQAAWQGIGEAPWLGHGISARMALVAQTIPPEALPHVAPLTHFHNQFLNTLYDHGLMGLLSLLLHVLGVALLLRLREGPVRVLRWQVGGVLLVHLSGFVGNANWTHGHYGFIFCLCWAMIVLMYMLAPKTSPNS